MYFTNAFKIMGVQSKQCAAIPLLFASKTFATIHFKKKYTH